MPPQELGGVVAPIALSRAYGLAEQMAIQIVRQRLHRRVAPVRLLAHRHRDDGVQVAAQARAQPLRRQAAAIRDPAAVGILFAAQFGNHHLARPHRVVHADGALELQLAVAQQPIRRTAGEQLVQQHAERVDVRGRGDRAAEHLFGRRVLRRQDSFLQPRHRQGVRQALRRQQLRDAEIEQLRRAFGRDEDIRRLDVPVHHQIAMRILHRRADLNEQLEALANEQGAAVAIRVDGFAIDVFHHEIGRSVLEIAAVDQSRDRRMIERGEDMPLAVQPAAQPRMQASRAAAP